MHPNNMPGYLVPQQPVDGESAFPMEGEVNHLHRTALPFAKFS